MKAAVYRKYGSPDVLSIKDVPRPVPGNKELLVRVYAATVNRTDCAMLRAKPIIMRLFTGLFRPKIPILGTDFAGIVEAAGKDITAFKTGDRVFGFDDSGLSSHAEYLTVHEGNALTTIPDNISYEQAAASIEGTHYAYNFINKVALLPGQKVLVNGGTGSIGSSAVQLSRYYGAHVTAVCKAKDTELVRSIGADEVIDYMTEDFTQSGEKYNFVFDAVGKSSYGKCKPLLESGGVYISSELGWMAQNIFFALFTPLLSKLRGKQGKKVIFPLPLDRKKSIDLTKKLTEEGSFRAVIDRQYPLEEIAEAFRYVEEGQKTGNVIINLS